MQAIILAGGFGTRLQTVVKDVPKPMADINGYPFLRYLLDALLKQGISKVILSVGYKKEVIKAYFDDHYLSMAIEYSSESRPLFTGGAIKQALALTDSEHVFVFNGDTFFDVNLQAMMRHHLQANADITLATKTMKDFDRYGTVVLNHERVIQFEDKKYQPEGLINGGVYLLQPNVFQPFRLPKKFSFENDFLETNLEKLQVNAFQSEGYFIDIGIPEDYLQAHTVFQRG